MSDDMLAKTWHQGRHVNDMQLETKEKTKRKDPANLYGEPTTPGLETRAI